MGSRFLCVTWNNPPPEFITDCELVSEYIRGGDKKGVVSYAIWQLERAASGTVHFQMYFEFKSPQRVGFLKKLLKTQALHAESRDGSREQARDYCRKEETRLAGPFEFGVWNNVAQGRRTDLNTAVDLVKEGKSLLEVYDVVGASAFRNAKYLNLARVAFAANVPRVKPVVVVHWGDSGTGKTHDAVGDLEPSQYHIKSPGKWWDGYECQDVVIIDDIQPDTSLSCRENHEYLLRVLDKWKMNVEIKGGSVPLTATRIFITSNSHPNDWFPSIHNKTPLLRRINRIVHYTGALYPNPVTKSIDLEHRDAFPEIPDVPLPPLPATQATLPPTVQEGLWPFADLEIPEGDN